ncbi:hypothetical protein G0U57_020280 [Chelydra serpentina]|uniref:Uncharacterized protein n=1 Tax=Chelydra serpentina TaxID=8475 RepID=A0A8T1SWL9_CHESE|nr:hypothetical protein G0U57_020280 [Chelydra serpentina]
MSPTVAWPEPRPGVCCHAARAGAQCQRPEPRAGDRNCVAGARDRSLLPHSRSCGSAPRASACRCMGRARSWMPEPRSVWLKPAPTIAWLEPAVAAAQPGPGVGHMSQLPPLHGRSLGTELGAGTCCHAAGAGDQHHGLRSCQWSPGPAPATARPELGVRICCPAARAWGWCLFGACCPAAGGRCLWPAPATAQLEPGTAARSQRLLPHSWNQGPEAEAPQLDARAAWPEPGGGGRRSIPTAPRSEPRVAWPGS